MDNPVFKTREITVSSLFNTITKDDLLFKGAYALDPYQNCSFGCLYCDSNLDDTIYIKHNALQLIQKEMAGLQRKRVIIGSIHDPYQPIEEKTRLTRAIIRHLLKSGFSIHILTKSTLVLRDIDIFRSYRKQLHITFSVISDDTQITKIFEPDVPSTLSRMKAMATLASDHINTGIAIMPLLPGFIDDALESLVDMAKQHNAQYVLFAHLFLKGEQKTRFLEIISHQFPQYLSLYESLFKDSMYPSISYQTQRTVQLEQICERVQLPTRIQQ